jgi:pyruvate kinase
MRRNRKAKIVATLGPASSTPVMIKRLAQAGADVFRLNFSHGTQEEQQARVRSIRLLEHSLKKPLGVLMDLQGPKLRVGKMAEGGVELEVGQTYRFDLDKAPGDRKRAPLPHKEIIEALKPGDDLLIDDGRIRLRIGKKGKDFVVGEVTVGGRLTDRKGVNVPGVVLPLTPLTEKDRADLAYGLELGVDWVALSFVQRPEDLAEARRLIGGRASLISKIEKPGAIEHLAELVELSDGILGARGDLGVEMPPESVPRWQKEMVRLSRLHGKPVVVATQMMESMVNAPQPTRAEASDVATAIYDGADAVMLSAESASGKFPVEAVAMMDRIIAATERDPLYKALVHAVKPPVEASAPDAISAAAAQVAETIGATLIVSYTTSGSTAMRAARERPAAPILVLTSSMVTARKLAILWGAHCVSTADIHSFREMAEKAGRIAANEGLAKAGDKIVITAGVPFGTPGSTNVLRIERVK